MPALHTCVPGRLRDALDALDASDNFRQAVGVETGEHLHEKVDKHADQLCVALCSALGRKEPRWLDCLPVRKHRHQTPCREIVSDREAN